MALNSFDRYNHLSELDQPLPTQEGVLSPRERKARMLQNMGLLNGATTALTATGTVADGASRLELNHATVVIAATWAAGTFPGPLLAIADTSASGTAAHTVTLPTGWTFDGTNNRATLNAPAEQLLVMFDEDGLGTILSNVGAVALSAV